MRNLRKIFYGVLIICVVLGFVGLVSCKKSNEPKDIKIGAIFAETGPASFLGAPEAKTARMIVDKINAEGGVNGKMINLIVKDSGANPEKAISFAKQLIEEEQVLAIIGPSTSGETMQIKDLCERSGTILISCGAAEAIVTPLASYVFKVPQKDSFVAKWIYQVMNSMDIKNIAVVAANTGFGNAGKGQLEKYAAEYGINIVITESYDKSATDLTAVLTKIKAKNVDAIVNWSIVPAQSIIPKNMKQLNMDIPLFQSHGFGNIKYVQAAGQAAEGIIFPCGKLVVANSLPSNDPQKKVLNEYISSYESKYNEKASTFGGHAYDAVLLIAKAIEDADSLEKAAVRDALENIKNFPGTGGVFNFTADDHNGLGMNSLEMVTVKNGEFAIYKTN